ncbi:sugar transferase [Streptomyces sp. NPDC015032]|uniref:sugar transferase n=1 Tax=Streptomyces sp. NPDC015032 TaxID=3364937 RepID=UPI0036FC14CB
MDLALGSVLLAVATPLLAAGALALAARRPPGGVLTRSPRIGLGGHPFVLRSLRTRRLRLDLLSRLPHVVRGDLSLVGPEPLTPDDYRARTAGAGHIAEATGTARTSRTAGAGDDGAGTDTPASGTAPAARHWRQELKPGLTGLAQVHSRSGMPWDEPALLDQHYAEHHWVGLDLAILMRAVHTPLRRAVRGLARRGKAHLSDTDHRRCGYRAAE